MASLSYCQESDSVSLARKKAQEENISFNGKINYTIIPKDGGKTNGLGVICELQIKSSERISFLATVNPIFEIKDRIQYLTTHISGGAKFYLEKESDFRGYFSLNAGLLLGGGDGLFAVSPAIGFEYKIDKDLRLNIEGKTFISFIPIISLSAGLCFN